MHGGGRHAAPQEEAMTHDVLGALRQEHRNMIALLLALEWQVKEFENGRQPDYEPIEATLDYFLTFPEALHHPREEQIFAALTRRAPDVARQIGDLHVAHEELAARARDFAAGLRAVLQDVEVSREAFARWARRFIEVQRQHIEMEERSFFPAAAKALETTDWSALGEAPKSDDPLVSDDAGARFEQLRRTILDWQARGEASLAK
jgi:hemerythrin-like domain-containing protein